MIINQIETQVNLLFDQSTGKLKLTKTDLTGIIAMGNTILSSDTNKDAFINTLIDRIAKTIISARPYTSALNQLLYDDLNYGAVVQKIYVEPFKAEDNTSWKLEDGADISTVTLKKPSVKQKLFEVRNSWQFEVSIPDYQLNSAFVDESSLAAFVSGIYTAINTSIEKSLEDMANACVNNFMAEKISYQASVGATGVHAINLLNNYNTLNSTTLTADKCLTDLEFLKYAGRQIKLHLKRMARLSEIYNIEKYKRHTPESELNVLLLTDFASATATYLQSNTFHDDLVSLPKYNEVSYWQGQGTSGAFEDVSKIDITTSTGKDVAQSGIIGFAFDTESLGIMLHRHESKAQYYPKAEVTQHWEKADMGYFNDLSENGLVFFVA